MKKTITYAIIMAFILCYHQTFSQSSSFSSDEYFISFKPGTSLQAIDMIKNDLNSSTVWSDNNLGLQLWKVDNFPFITSEGDTITNINENVVVSEEKTEVDNVGYNYTSNVIPFDDYSISCDQHSFALYSNQGSNSVKISILDTGISDIGDNSQDGFNFTIHNYTGYDYINEDQFPEDENGHGSHVAGVIADIINYSPYQYVSIDIRKTHDSNGQGYISDIIRAITDAVYEGANVINMSFSYKINIGAFNPLKVAIDFAEANGVLVVASAGNTSQDNDNPSQASYPASFNNDNIISVASNDCDNELSWFSNYGRESVDVSILGERIAGPDLGSGLSYKSGTSQATAIVSAVSAVLGTHQRFFDGVQIKCALINTSDYSPGLDGYVVSNGVINSDSAIEGLQLCEGSNHGIIETRSIYPDRAQAKVQNPFRDQMNIEILENNGIFSLYNMHGQLIRKGELIKGMNQISGLESLQSGHYILSVLTTEGTFNNIPVIKI